MGAIAFLHSKTPRTFLNVRLADMHASSRNASDIHFSTQCVSLQTFIQSTRIWVVLIWTLSPILKGLITKSVMMLHWPLSPRSTVLVGNEEPSQTRQLKFATAVRVAPRWRNMAYHAYPWGLHVRHHVSRSGKGLVSCPSWWGTLLDVQFVWPQSFTVVRPGAMGWLHNLLLFKMVMEMSQSRACICLPAEGLQRCRRAVAVVD